MRQSRWPAWDYVALPARIVIAAAAAVVVAGIVNEKHVPKKQPTPTLDAKIMPPTLRK